MMRNDPTAVQVDAACRDFRTVTTIRTVPSTDYNTLSMSNDLDRAAELAKTDATAAEEVYKRILETKAGESQLW